MIHMTISDEELDILNRNSNRIILFSQTEPKTHINGEVVLVTAAGHKIYSVVKKIYTLKYLDNERSKPIATSRFRCLMEMFNEFLNATDCVITYDDNVTAERNGGFGSSGR